MTRFLAICLGGALGTGARYLVTLWMARWAGTAFPWATLAINAVGSFLVSLILVVALATEALSPTSRMTLTIGVMGGFTTYSTFNHDTLNYFQQGDWRLGLANLVATVLGCLASGWLGFAVGRALTAG